MMLSTSQKYAAKMKTVTRTTIVVDCTSAREGEITLRISLRTSLRNSPRRAGCVLSCCNPVLGCSVTAIVLAIVLPQSSWCFCDVGPGLEGPGKLAGELGFEPRSSVLETDSLTVELTPPVLWDEAAAPYPKQAELLRLFVRRVLAAGVAVLVGLETAGGGLLVLGGGVVPVLAIRALQCDDLAH